MLDYAWIDDLLSFSGTSQFEVLRSTNNAVKPNHESIREVCARQDTKTKAPTDKRKQNVDQVLDADYVPSNTHSSQGESLLYIFEDSEAVIKLMKAEFRR